MEYALIKNGAVENVIAADQDYIDLIAHLWDHIERIDTPEEQALGIGVDWRWDGTGFIPPEPKPPEPRHITVGAFFDRLGTEKYAILSSDNILVKALITDVSVRKFIDLDRPDLLAGLQMVEQAGFDIDPEAIVSTEIQQSERP